MSIPIPILAQRGRSVNSKVGERRRWESDRNLRDMRLYERQKNYIRDLDYKKKIKEHESRIDERCMDH